MLVCSQALYSEDTGLTNSTGHTPDNTVINLIT